MPLEGVNMSVENRSILEDVRKNILGSTDDTFYDKRLIDDINTIFMLLYQKGIGPSDHAFSIGDSTETWHDFLSSSENELDYQAVRTYMYKKVQLLFDPPSNSVLYEAMNSIIDELEWHMMNESEGFTK